MKAAVTQNLRRISGYTPFLYEILNFGVLIYHLLDTLMIPVVLG